MEQLVGQLRSKDIRTRLQGVANIEVGTARKSAPSPRLSLSPPSFLPSSYTKQVARGSTKQFICYLLRYPFLSVCKIIYLVSLFSRRSLSPSQHFIHTSLSFPWFDYIRRGRFAAQQHSSTVAKILGRCYVRRTL